MISKFKSCLHCGSKTHRRFECKAKKALLGKSGGKLPAGFKSAFDIWKAQQLTKVSALTGQDLIDDDGASEAESAPIWGMTCNAISSVPLCRPCHYKHQNAFAAIFHETSLGDKDEDEADMLQALKSLTPNVSIGPKVSQKRKAIGSQSKPLDRRTVASIAKQVRDGKFNVPYLRLESKNEFEAVWALVDLGATRSCAQRRDNFLSLALSTSHQL